MARAFLLFSTLTALAVGGAACETATLKTPTPTPTEAAASPDERDEDPTRTSTEVGADASASTNGNNNGGAHGDSGASTETDAGASGCPVPAKLTTANIPSGYMAPVRVTISFLADGDSGRFNFPTASDQGVRMLYVNTEESGGAEMTDFGVQTKLKVHPWIRAAQNIEIAVRESAPGSGLPDVDPYGRWLSLIFLDGQLLQERIVREGLSAYYVQFGCAPTSGGAASLHSTLLWSEAEANARDLGIWSSAPSPAHNDYSVVLTQWIGNRTCRPNPFKNQPYCP